MTAVAVVASPPPFKGPPSFVISCSFAYKFIIMMSHICARMQSFFSKNNAVFVGFCLFVNQPASVRQSVPIVRVSTHGRGPRHLGIRAKYYLSSMSLHFRIFPESPPPPEPVVGAAGEPGGFSTKSEYWSCCNSVFESPLSVTNVVFDWVEARDCQRFRNRRVYPLTIGEVRGAARKAPSHSILEALQNREYAWRDNPSLTAIQQHRRCRGERCVQGRRGTGAVGHWGSGLAAT